VALDAIETKKLHKNKPVKPHVVMLRASAKDVKWCGWRRGVIGVQSAAKVVSLVLQTTRYVAVVVA